MKLPKMSAGVDRGTIQSVRENAGILPSDIGSDITNPCKVQCRATQAVEMANCPRSGLAAGLCLAAAQLKGENCVTSCPR